MNTPTSPLPDLFPYLVPKGADVPEGVRTCRRHGCAESRGVAVIEHTGYRGSPIWTEVPIPEPRPAPPNPYDRLENVITTNGNHWDCAFWALDSERDTDTVPWLCISRAEAVELALSIVCSEDFQRLLSEDYKRAYENGVKCAEGSRRHHP